MRVQSRLPLSLPSNTPLQFSQGVYPAAIRFGEESSPIVKPQPSALKRFVSLFIVPHSDADSGKSHVEKVRDEMMEKKFFSVNRKPFYGRDVLLLLADVLREDGKKTSAGKTDLSIPTELPLRYLFPTDEEARQKLLAQYTTALTALDNIGFIEARDQSVRLTDAGAKYSFQIRTPDSLVISSAGDATSTSPVSAEQKLLERLKIMTQTFLPNKTGWDVLSTLAVLEDSRSLFMKTLFTPCVTESQLIHGIKEPEYQKAILKKALPALQSVGLANSGRGGWWLTDEGRSVYSKGNPSERITSEQLCKLFEWDAEKLRQLQEKQEAAVRKLEADAAKAEAGLQKIRTRQTELMEKAGQTAEEAARMNDAELKAELEKQMIQLYETANAMNGDIEVEGELARLVQIEAQEERQKFDEWNNNEVKPTLTKLRTAQARTRLAEQRKDLTKLLTEVQQGYSEAAGRSNHLIRLSDTDQATSKAVLDASEAEAKARKRVESQVQARQSQDVVSLIKEFQSNTTK